MQRRRKRANTCATAAMYVFDLKLNLVRKTFENLNIVCKEDEGAAAPNRYNTKRLVYLAKTTLFYILSFDKINALNIL